MSNVVTNLPDIISAGQNIFLYSNSFDGVLSNGLDGKIVETVSIDSGVFLLSSFFIEDFQTTRGKTESFDDDQVCDLCTVSIETSTFVNTSNVYSATCILQVGTGSELEIFTSPMSAIIAIPWEVKFLGKKRLKDSKQQLVRGFRTSLNALYDSRHTGILNGAIHAANIYFPQMIHQVYGKKDLGLKVSYKYTDIIDTDSIIDNGVIIDYRFINIIRIASVFVGGVPRVSLKCDADYVPSPEPFEPEIVNLDDIYSSTVVVTNNYGRESVYSPIMSFRSIGYSTGVSVFEFAKFVYEKDLNDFLSNELKMVNIVRGARSETCIPALVSNNDKGYKLSTSLEVHNEYPLYHLFNNNIESYTAFTDYRKAEVIIELPDTRQINSYSIGCGHYYNSHYDAPSEWTLYTSVDGKTFIDVDKVYLNRQMNSGEVISRAVYSRPEARFIKMYITHNNRGGAWTRIGLLDFIFFDKSYDYKIIDTDGYYSIRFNPTVDIYSDNDYFNLDDAVYQLAIWNEHKSFNGIKRDVGRFRISSIQPSTLSAATLPIATLHIIDMTIVEIDFGEYLSPSMIIQAGVKQDINKDGLFRDIFVEENYDTVIDSSIPWLNSYGSMRRLTNSKFYDISFDTTEISIYNIGDSKYETVLLDWERILISGNGWEIPDYRLYPYMKIIKPDGDFIIIALSVSGGSLVHVHKKGFMNEYEYGYQFRSDRNKLLNPDIDYSVDASIVEDCVIEVSSFRYRKNAQILKDVIDGAYYDSDVIVSAKGYLSSRSHIVKDLAGIDVNPIVLGSILKDKMSGMIDLDVFYTSEPYSYDGVDFIYYDLDSIPASQNTTEYVISHKNISIGNSESYVGISLDIFRPVGTKYINYIDNCGIGTKCHNHIVVESKFNSIIYKDSAKIVGNVSQIVFNKKSTVHSHDELPIGEYGDNISTHNLLLRHFLSMSVPENTSGITSKESNIVITIGTKYNGLMYPGSLKIGLEELYGIVSKKNHITISIPDTMLDDVYSDFNIDLTIYTRNDFFEGIFSIAGKVTVNSGFIDLSEIYDRTPYFWMKMFFPLKSSSADISSMFMDFNITERSFEKTFNLPYYYVDDPISYPQYRTEKSRNNGINEIKLKDFEDFGSNTKLERNTDLVCGEERSMTYLDFQAFDHIFTSDNRRVYGNYTQSDREMLMSGFIRRIRTRVIAPGKKLADIDAMKKSLTEIQLSFIKNLPDVANWHIEDFKLDYTDFNLSADQAEMLNGMQESFRGLMKAVVNTLGDDFASYEATNKTNLFPGFPDRPPQENGFASYKVSQFFIVKEVENV